MGDFGLHAARDDDVESGRAGAAGRSPATTLSGACCPAASCRGQALGASQTHEPFKYVRQPEQRRGVGPGERGGQRHVVVVLAADHDPGDG